MKPSQKKTVIILSSIVLAIALLVTALHFLTGLCPIEHLLSMDEKATPSETTTLPANDRQAAGEAFLNILFGDGRFVYEGKLITVSEYQNEPFDENEHIEDRLVLRFEQFTLVDMDGDGIAEIIFEQFPSGVRLILRYENGVVYGYEIGYRGMTSLKKDGTHQASGSAFHTLFCRLKFSDGTCTQEVLAEYVGFDGENTYYINNQEVTEEEFRVFVDIFDEKEDAQWYAYSDETILRVLTT